MHSEPKRKGDLQSLVDGTLTEADARALLESWRWPNGIVCPLPHCGGSGAYRIEGKAKKLKSGRMQGPRSLYKCKACKRQFSVTKGTIFEDSKVPLRTWLIVMYRMCSSKKGVSARQIGREFGLTPESAWFLCHRVRHAMRDQDTTPLSGIVEANETWIGGRPRGHRLHRAAAIHRAKYKGEKSPRTIDMERKTPVFGIRERGGRVRVMPMPGITQHQVERKLLENLLRGKTRLITDEHKYYHWISGAFPHDVIRHNSEYVRGDIHTQGIESFWSILKRGIIGTYHHVDAGYLGPYTAEFAFRHNTREITDAERFRALIGQIEGRVDWYLGKQASASASE
ncbi:MAG: IS1595 family transposase [Dehalococcoidia bacterium]